MAASPATHVNARALQRQMQPIPKRHLFLTGAPGAGKSTLIKSVLSALSIAPAEARGFYTEEVRSNSGERIGFDVVTLDGQRAPLARAGSPGKGKPMVGKYSVDVASFEALALPQLDPEAQDVRLWVVDEVGKMELKSRRFFPAVSRLLDSAPLVLGTLPLPQAGRLIPEVEAVRERPDVRVVAVRRDNRDELVGELGRWLAAHLRGGG